VLEDSVAHDYRRHQPNLPLAVETVEALKEVVRSYRTGLPDLEVVIDQLIAEGDRVVTRVVARGTHTGDLAGIRPTGNRVEITATDIFRMANGRIAESWHNVDDYGILQQVGALS
jgi:predicted ester cyclase